MKHLLALCLVLIAACGDSPTTPPPDEPVPDTGTMHVEITGAVQLSSTWTAFGEFRDLIAGETGERSYLGGQVLDTDPYDSTITVVFPGRLEPGQFAIGRFEPGVPLTTPVAYMEFDDEPYTSLPGGTLKVTSAAYPPRPGLTFGVLKGTIDFKAVNLSDDTISVHANFIAHWYHYLFPNVRVTLGGGGPISGTSTFAWAQSLPDDRGGRFIESNVDFRPVYGFPYDVTQELRILAPSVGTRTLTALTPEQFADPGQWPAAYAALWYRDDPRMGLSTGGTLTITRVLEPTLEYYGEIQGTLTAPLALWIDETTVSADTVDAEINFAVQLWPLGGVPGNSYGLTLALCPVSAASSRTTASTTTSGRSSCR